MQSVNLLSDNLVNVVLFFNLLAIAIAPSHPILYPINHMIY